MKAHFLETINPKPLAKCESTFTSLASRFLSLSRGLLTPVRTNRWSQTFAHAESALRAGLAALRLATTTLTNRRIFVGLGLMGVVAPLASCFYMVFDRGAYDESWYYVNHFHLFLTLAPSLFLLSCLIGAWLLFPQGSKRAYALVVPTGFTVGKILWLLQCTSNADFYSVVPLSFILIGALISAFLFMALDWLVWRKCHREDAFEARMTNLVKLADDFDDAKFKSMVKTVWREKKQFEKQY